MTSDRNRDERGKARRAFGKFAPAKCAPVIYAPVLAAVLVLAVSGCTVIPDAALIDPAKYNYYGCDDLERAIKPHVTRAREIRQLEAKALREEIGVAVNALTYEPEYKSERGEMELIEAVSRRKECKPPTVMPAEFAAELRTP